MGPKAIAEALEKPYSSITTLLQKLVSDGLLRSPGYGKYEPAADASGSIVSPQGPSPGEGENGIDEQSFTTFTTFSGLDKVGSGKDADGVSVPSGETDETGETSRIDAEEVPDSGETAGETLPEGQDGGAEEGGEFECVRSVLESPPDWMKNTYLKGFREGRWDARLVANAVAIVLQMSPHDDGPRIRPIVEDALEELEIRPK